MRSRLRRAARNIVQMGLVVEGMMAPWAAGAYHRPRKKKRWFRNVPKIPTQSSVQRSLVRSESRVGGLAPKQEHHQDGRQPVAKRAGGDGRHVLDHELSGNRRPSPHEGREENEEIRSGK